MSSNLKCVLFVGALAVGQLIFFTQSAARAQTAPALPFPRPITPPDHIRLSKPLPFFRVKAPSIAGEARYAHTIRLHINQGLPPWAVVQQYLKNRQGGSANAQQINNVIAATSDSPAIELPASFPAPSSTNNDTETFDDFSTLELDLTNIYPGALLSGSSFALGNGLFEPPIDRGAYTLTIGPGFVNGSSSATSFNANLPACSGSDFQGDVYQSVNGLVQQYLNSSSSGSTDTNLQLVYSSAQTTLDAEAAFSGFGASLNGAVSEADDKTKNHLLFTFLQELFAVTYEPTASPVVTPADFFGSDVTAADLSELLGNPNSTPLFVHTVDYGRYVYLLVNTTNEKSQAAADITAAYQAIGASGSASAGFSQTYDNSSTSFKLLTLGNGDPDNSILSQAAPGPLSGVLTAIHNYLGARPKTAFCGDFSRLPG